MSQETGINYYYNALQLETGAFACFYTFNEGAGTTITSISGGQSEYSAALSSSTNFWIKPGSGFFSGQYAQINNASGLDSSTWTDIFVFEKININPIELFSSLNGTSGYKIGVTAANKVYFESFGQEPVIAASLNNLSSKNAIAVSYLPNYVSIGYYNFASQSMESEGFDFPFEVSRSDDRKLCPSYTGYIDYYIHLNQYLNPQIAGQLMSGLYSYNTGIGCDIQTICSTGITGYQDVLVIETGTTGQMLVPGGDEGQGYYTGAFPTYHTTVHLTGILSSGFFSSGITGVVCSEVTGSQIVLLETLTGYAASFGMQKIQSFTFTSGWIVKDSYSRTLFDNNYNKFSIPNYSGFEMGQEYDTGVLDLFWNGVAQSNFGWTNTGTFLFVSGAAATDAIFFDIKTGSKVTYTATGQTVFPLLYTGQETYLNGVNLISGYDFSVNAGVYTLTAQNTGITGYLFEYPVGLISSTGNYSMKTGTPFTRNSSNLYINGVRQQILSAYTEGAIFDLLSGNSFDPSDTFSIYDNTDLYWE